MNRIGLVVALLIGVAVGVIFGVWPELDVLISRLFFDEKISNFPALYSLVSRHLRDLFTYIVILLAAPAFVALVLKLILPRRRMIIPARAALFIIATLALAPGLMTNVILKDNWHRPRPGEVTQLGGTEQFMPWWDPRGSCDKNCSFVAGEGSGAFWSFAPAALAPAAWLPVTYGAAILFGLAAGLQRVSGGAHFFSDVAFSGVFTFLVIWILYGLIYRWRTRLTDAQVEGWIERVALPPHNALRRLLGRA